MIENSLPVLTIWSPWNRTSVFKSLIPLKIILILRRNICKILWSAVLIVHFTHICKQIGKKQPKKRFVNKIQPMGRSADIQRWPLSSDIHRTGIYTQFPHPLIKCKAYWSLNSLGYWPGAFKRADHSNTVKV